MDDIVFVRSVEKRRAPPLGGGSSAKRAKLKNVPAEAVSPSSATKQKADSNGAQTAGSDVYPKLPRPEQQEPEQEESFLLATRNALEQALGKEALEAHEKLLVKEKESKELYIVNLEEAVKQQYGTPVVHDILIQNQMAILKVKAEGHDEAAKTEIKLLRESNTKLRGETTTLGRCVRLLTDENIVLKRQHEGTRAEIQILYEHNTKLTEENTALARNIGLLKDGDGTSKAKRQEEAARTAEIKSVRQYKTKLADEKAALVRRVKLLSDEHDTLRAEISALTQDVDEQKRLCKSKMRESDSEMKAAATKSKKFREKFKNSNKKLTKKNTDLSRKIVELESGHAAEVLEARVRVRELQGQVEKLEQGFRQRGEQLIELSRDSVLKDRIKMQKEAAIEAKDLLQKRMSGMFKNYQALFKKNKILLNKLVLAADEGRFGDGKKAKIYREGLKLLEGQPLEGLYEFKHQV
ncbi:uncharacterized protein ALTATR162_LOCUS10772 [Alternaria atra]|uniref:Uncharacterized protein n=1 Tax=Alternaria atra TaxID=119953 RepID=A0A8J2I465_9PLEO|nr:uncharacterized protein ALTATR162_LOCUS7975 [Alternaria atra]XP_043174347.1 uncharacterized protein ALTATR162_LOCUS10772 [Alternaria atra]CAG5175111.1 unnamed protein product [Alternaria atra]CAG5183827.1 unnamed protein product [Alternaria atra]